MTDTFIKNTQVADAPTIRGELTYENKVIEKIVGLAVTHIDGLLAVNGGYLANIKNKLVNTDTVREGVSVEVGKKQVAVDLDIIAEYQKHVPTIFDEIKKTIETEVKKMTDLDVIEVNVNVVDIKTKAQHEADTVSLQDKVAEAAHATSEFTSKQVGNVKSTVNDNMQTEPRVK